MRNAPRVAAALSGAAMVLTLTQTPPAVADHTPPPTAVSVPGSHGSELGCPGDWQPECAQAQLALDPADGIWKGSFAVPAGTHEYKATLNNSWTENYGAGAVPGGANIPYTTTGGTVSFYYDHATHLVTSSAEGPIVTAPGSFTSELGCPGDWAPECMRSWLQDPDGDGVFTFSSTAIPAGAYEVKAAHGLSWAENYGAGGVPNGPNIPFFVAADGDRTTFSYVLATHVLTVSAGVAPPNLGEQRAQWLTRDLLALDLPADTTGWTFRMVHAPDGGLVATPDGVTGGQEIPLTLDPAGLPAPVRERYPHLAGYEALRVPAADVPAMLTGQLAVAAFDARGRLADATGVQTHGVLDDVYAAATGAKLGPTWQGHRPALALWAPTAKNVVLLLDEAGPAPDRRVAMRRGPDGVWRVDGHPSWRAARYAYEVTVYVSAEDAVRTNVVTDPYSLGLTANAGRSVLVDLADRALEPDGWDRLAKPRLAQPEDTTIYELHVRDFSITDETVPAAHRGTYLAFTHERSAGMRHLRGLADAGLNSLHLLPTNDIASIEERRSAQQQPACDLPSFGPAAPDQQACVEPVRDADGFNWGYDPLHYTTPEGSYSTNSDGTARTREFREMVKAVNRTGLRVVMDVVYNHTPASGQDRNSVLDRIVPGYYHRLSATGRVETSTCCANTATEHRMMEKLMVDSVVTWAREYKVDGFRFDLMGHHSKANMLAVRAALDALTVRRDGVDGRSIYLYGEGWNFGEVADNARFVQASQLNLPGTGIGTFTDRLRDAVRGGGPFDADPRIQGFATGLFTDPNGAPVNGTPDQQRARLLLHHDQIKVGLAGNLRDYTFVNRDGVTVRGSAVDYNGQPAGYAADPSETITYADAHDNETLFDVIQYKLPQATPMADRVRMNTLALATVAFAQSPSFWHAGTDLLRSKSLDRNSFNSGDWFNRIDWSYRDSTWGSGLPPRTDNESKWSFMGPLLADPALEPRPADIRAAHDRALELLRIRFSSPLFRLGSAQLVQQRLSFPTGGPEQTPGVIVLAIDDRRGPDLDPRAEGIVVVFNATPNPTTQTVPALAGARYALHPVQASGSDPVLRTAGYTRSTGAFTVPPRTVAVFVTR
ncbi:MAG TPA: pullulanase-type alpha-1,6-glucosidase [Actinophytocola sp.]|uniref:pullulanase-type alpha-1,6-glucosidase n=1 Tax=Actinophytocola sp. TaxID=1872138 RepID=UPI002DBE28AE|nr:pullulanase-type alpha-1,6-glucosidase [Actinophytocola sp.]HEU5472285.1 pullulanase-type alpha-1,6-glucosidase [Actinophytocola sp.]